MCLIQSQCRIVWIRLQTTSLATAVFLGLFLTVPSVGQSPAHSELTLRSLGHASFEWITPTGTRIIIDPYDDSWWSHWFNRSFPQVPADIVLVTHPHFDHDAVSRVAGDPQVLREAGVKEGNGYTIRAITGHHARSDKYGDRNLIFIVEVAGVRFCHWGDNDAHLTDELKREIGPVDVLMVPVDASEHLLTLEEVDVLIKELSPRIVVPMHYFDPDLTSVCSTLGPIDDWLKTHQNVRRISEGSTKLSSSELPKVQQIWVFARFGGYESRGDGKDSNVIPCRFQARGPQFIAMYLCLGVLVVFLEHNSSRQLRGPQLLGKWLIGILKILFWPIVLGTWLMTKSPRTRSLSNRTFQ